MTQKGKRLDLLLEELGYCDSRQVARTAIMDGSVIVNGNKVTKPGTLIKDGAKIEFSKNWKNLKFVSRGGYKLEKALLEFKINTKGRVCLDIGASTGGFTDCLLQSGARFVYAIDVGYGQIAWSLRTDPRVKVIERTNARNVTNEIIYGALTQEQVEASNGLQLADLAVIDVSFISITKVLPAVKNCLAKDFAEILALVKPQFEAGPENVGKGGVVKSKEVHYQVIVKTISDLEKAGLYSHALTFSPLKGPNGNVEFLLHLRLDQKRIEDDYIRATVEAASLL